MKATIFIAIYLIMTVSAFPTGEPVTVSAVPSDTVITIGDTLSLDIVIRVQGDPDDFVIDEPIYPEPNHLRIISTGLSVRKVVTDSIPITETIRTVNYLAVDTGMTVVSPIEMSCMDKSTEDLIALQTTGHRIRITGSGNAAQKTRDLALLGGLVTIVIVFSIIVYVRVQRGRQELASEEEDAGDEFAAILQKIKLKAAHGKLAEAQVLLLNSLKQYLKEEFGFSPDDKANLSDKIATRIPEPMYDIFVELDEANDDAKFGGRAIAEDDLFNLIEKLQKTLEQSN